MHETFAWTFLKNGDRESALAAANHAVELAPKIARTHRTLGRIRLHRGEWTDAEAAYRQALAINPRHYGALNDLGLAFEAQGRFPEAVRMFEQAAEMAPTNRTIRRNLERRNREPGTAPPWAQSIGIIGDVEPETDIDPPATD